MYRFVEGRLFTFGRGNDSHLAMASSEFSFYAIRLMLKTPIAMLGYYRG